MANLHERMGRFVPYQDISKHIAGRFPTPLEGQELQEIQDQVRDITTGESSDKRMRLMMCLFDSSARPGDSVEFAKFVSDTGLRGENLRDIFLDSKMHPLYSTMAAREELFRMQLGIVFSQISVDSVPAEIQEKLNPRRSQLRSTVTTTHASWGLCESAESLMERALKDKAIMAVGEEDSPHLLMKFNGKLSGLCLENVRTDSGRLFIKGNWYSPVDSRTKGVLYDGFYTGQSRRVWDSGNWVLMRPTKGQLAEAQLEVQRLPESFGEEIHVLGRKMNRVDYRNRFGERSN